MNRPIRKTPFLNLSVEEENLAAIPFAVLERRVGKRVGKLDIRGTKLLPDGTELGVLWQVQGNNELGLPTEQDLDIFVALGVLTFRNNFAKTVSFTGREIAAILNISSVHGKFYQRLKVAMDRFIPLRFRALMATDQQEEVKWLNVFQEASFSLDRTSGRCTGSVTWTDKVIQSMDSGFFRLLDAGRYMELDGITAKHLYRFLAVAFEKTDVILIDARKLACEHLGILSLPKYFSRLMQTLEPAFEQLIRIEVLRSYHVVAAEQWRIALRRHANYVSEWKNLLIEGGIATAEAARVYCQRALEKAGFPAKGAAEYCDRYQRPSELYALQRAAHLAEEMKREEVTPAQALLTVRRAIDLGPDTEPARELLDWCEIALEICRQKRRSGQQLKNLPGLLMKIIKDEPTRRRMISAEAVSQAKHRFRQREQAAQRNAEAAEERKLILEYEQFRERLARSLFEDMPEPTRQALRKEKSEQLKQQDRYERMPQPARDHEVEQMVLQDLARKEAPPFERWRLRMRAQQVLLPFGPYEELAGSLR